MTSVPFRLDKTATRSNRVQTKFPDHCKRIRECPCVICGMPAECSHVRMSSSEYGKTNGRDDKWVLPLCAGHHRLYPDAQHNSGEAIWWVRRGIDPLKIAQELWNNRDDLEIMKYICGIHIIHDI